jgi:hypothetical protein
MIPGMIRRETGRKIQLRTDQELILLMSRRRTGALLTFLQMTAMIEKGSYAYADL